MDAPSLRFKHFRFLGFSCDEKEGVKHCWGMSLDAQAEARAVINDVVLTSALKLCTQIEDPAAWHWGKQLWQQTEEAGS